MKIEVLDFGYVELIETWGSDERIIEAARMSTQKGFEGWGPRWKCSRALCDWKDTEPIARSRHDLCPKCGCSEIVNMGGDEKLLAYLWKNNHATPFEFAGMVIEVKAPLFVFREWHRHRAAGYNEQSARYAPLPDENYMPTIERLMIKSGHKTKQAASTGAELVEADALKWLSELADVYDYAERVYRHGLEIGVPKELARLSMTVGRYSRMRATTNLRMWLHFEGLRMAPVAQWEIRAYANAVGEILASKFPRTWSLFNEKKESKP